MAVEGGAVAEEVVVEEAVAAMLMDSPMAVAAVAVAVSSEAVRHRATFVEDRRLLTVVVEVPRMVVETGTVVADLTGLNVVATGNEALAPRVETVAGGLRAAEEEVEGNTWMWHIASGNYLLRT